MNYAHFREKVGFSPSIGLAMPQSVSTFETWDALVDRIKAMRSNRLKDEEMAKNLPVE